MSNPAIRTLLVAEVRYHFDCSFPPLALCGQRSPRLVLQLYSFLSAKMWDQCDLHQWHHLTQELAEQPSSMMNMINVSQQVEVSQLLEHLCDRGSPSYHRDGTIATNTTQ